MVVGHFDPVYAPHAHRLNQLRSPGQTLAVLLVDPPQPLLTLQARAELVASLAAVDYVILSQDNAIEELIARLAPDEVLQETADDLQRTASLATHVRQRQSAR